MSGIWHNKKEKPMMHTDIILCGNGWSMPIGIIPETVNTICWENVEKWCYLDDLLACETELEHTREAFRIAVDALKDIRCIYTGDQTTKPSTMFGCATSALNKIQEL